MRKKLLNKITYTRILVVSFAVIIFLGTALLSLPFATKSGISTPPLNALFTATSATCVTGLVIYDTFTHWSIFGQIVILCLIQVGGLGFMLLISTFSVFLKRKISMYEKSLLMQAEGNLKLSGVDTLLKRIIKGTFILEGIGAVILSTQFVPELGPRRGIYYAVFHAVSAFCNAGFDLMGKYERYSSLTYFSENKIVMLTITTLIIIGGIGFIVWTDVVNLKFKLKKYSLHSKIVLTTTALLIVIPTILFLLFEHNNVLKEFNIIDKIINAVFMAVSPRTAGFNSVELSNLTTNSKIITDFLMLVGGSPGSTAGGLKTTTFAVLIISTLATARHDVRPEIFKRKLSPDALPQASAIFVVYVAILFVAVSIICGTENLTSSDVIFECISAIGTVGSSLGITNSLHGISKLVIIALMFGGRVGMLSLILFLTEKKADIQIDRPTEKILIG
ncbi:MAG: TrkH family potassium uptake protein [Acutalibacteraceae bacterium]